MYEGCVIVNYNNCCEGEVKKDFSEEGRGLPHISQDLKDDLGEERVEKPADRWFSICETLR